VSPILVRPVREQLEHDRVIRLLQGRFRRRFEVGINPGHEQNAVAGSGQSVSYPDVVLMSADGGRKLQGVIEVETTESVNHLEAMSQWVRLSKLRAPFHLYVPAATVDAARRLCASHRVNVAEVVSFHSIGDQIRFITVYRAPADAPRTSAKRSGAGTRQAAATRKTPRPGAKVKGKAGARPKPKAKARAARKAKPKTAARAKARPVKKGAGKTTRTLKRK
jgi:hypothetical protein